MPAPPEKDEEADLEVKVAKIVLTDVPDKLDGLLSSDVQYIDF